MFWYIDFRLFDIPLRNFANVKIVLSNSVKNVNGSLMGMASLGDSHEH